MNQNLAQKNCDENPRQMKKKSANLLGYNKTEKVIQFGMTNNGWMCLFGPFMISDNI